MAEMNLLTESEVADLLHVKRQTLALWRMTRRVSLPYQKIGRVVRYRERDVLAFIEDNTITPAAIATA